MMISGSLEVKTIQLQPSINFLWKPLNNVYAFIFFSANLLKYMQWCLVVVSVQDLLFFDCFDFNEVTLIIH